MKLVTLIARIVIGITFIFSGTVKAIDPTGSAIKFEDYFNAFNLELFSPLSLPLAIFLCTVEFIAGFSVLTGIKLKTGIKLAMLLMVIFTPLTLILALTNPVSDCGCFGDAVKLTNWQTFWKNVVLIAFTSFLFFNLKKYQAVTGNKRQWMILGLTALIFIAFSVYNLLFLPIVDFLPYKKGVRIAEQMVIPEGAEPDRYETTFIYEKDGIQKEFTLDNYPAEDTTWRFIDQKSILVEKGYQPPIHDFAITGPNGEDMTDRILSHSGKSVLMIVRKLEETVDKRLQSGFEFGRECMNNNINFYVLTASVTDEIAASDSSIMILKMDETTLKTMVRSNPGYMLISDGIISDKWSWTMLGLKERILTSEK